MYSIFWVLLMAHVLGDYYFQNEELADRKKKSYKGVMTHSLVYLAVMMVFTIPYLNLCTLLLGVTAGVLHFVVDTAKYFISKLEESANPKVHNWMKKFIGSGKLYVGDQVVHILLLMVVVFIYYMELMGPTYPEWLSRPVISGISRWIRIVLAALILMKPTNITFKQLFGSIKPVKSEEVNYLADKSAGRMIGNLERILILLLLLQNQFGAVGLVFTAKSITRYNKIVEDKQFGEYYLLGTLFSLLASIVVYMVVVGAV